MNDGFAFSNRGTFKNFDNITSGIICGLTNMIRVSYSIYFLEACYNVSHSTLACKIVHRFYWFKITTAISVT